ncbi:MAG: T9SS type A sorting domain-containing protein [Chitinophagales bacterium]|nr:T9SS type A sorting domain-containing protein [Chitinophagales bacterium]
MKHNYLTYLFFLLSLTLSAQSVGPDLKWLSTIQSAADSPEDLGMQIMDVAVSPGTEIYVAGFCTAPCAFAQGVAVIPEAGGLSYFIAKYDANGVFEWVKDLGTIGEHPMHIVAPSVDGVYLATSFSVPSVALGNNITVNKTCTGAACNEVLLAKFGPAGETLWAKTYKGDSGSFFQVSGIEQAGSGKMAALINYDTELLDLGPGFVDNTQQETGFLLSFFDANTGTTTDVKFPGVSESSPTSQLMAYNSSGQGVMVGSFFDQITFSNGTTLTTNLPNGANFAVGLNATGEVLWIKKISSSDYADILAADMDEEGAAYLAIDASTDLKLDDGNILSINTSYAGAVLKLQGSSFSIPVFIPYDTDDYAIMDVAIHPWGIIYTAGYTSATITYGDNQVVPDGCVDGFITETNQDGLPISARTVGGAGCEAFANEYYGSCLGFGLEGNLVGAGGFLFSFNEDGFSANGRGGFVTKFLTTMASTSDLHWGNVELFPNPCAGVFTLKLPEVPSSDALISISNTQGQEVFRQLANQQEIRLETSLSAGMYLITVTDGKRIYRGKIQII